MDKETSDLLTALQRRLDRDMLEIKSSVIAQRMLIEELLVGHFADQPEVFEEVIAVCCAAARSMKFERPGTQDENEDMQATVAAKIQRIGGEIQERWLGG